MRFASLCKYAYQAFVRQDPLARYTLADHAAALLDPIHRMSEYGRDYLFDEPFRAWYVSFCGSNYHSLDRKVFVKESLKWVVDVEGETAECGVYEGATSFLIASAMASRGCKHYAFDSFQGLSAPQEVDGNYWKKGHLTSTEAVASRRLASLNNVELLKGWIPERFSEVESKKFRFLHIDVDLYQPTYDSLTFFYPRMNSKSVIICDDYGFIKTCPGARRAMHDFFRDKPEPIISVPTGQGLVIKL